MGHKTILIIAIFLANVCLLNGLNLETRKLCCTLGTNYSSNGLDCGSFQPPIAGVQKNEETQCLHFVDVCCKNQYREKQCELGRADAKAGGSCSASTDGDRKSCCEGCQMGIDTGKSGESCQDTLGLGAQSDKAFITCCEEIATSTTVSTTPSTTTSTTPYTYPTSQLFRSTRKEPFYPLPSMESLCDSGEVCAQICEPTVDSYKCSCYKGYLLMEDGISCKPEKRVLKKGGRCEHNNPCDQDCIDTGTAIKCSCRDGYELMSDKKTCKDIDERALNIHECAKDEECSNDEGSYSCYEFVDTIDDVTFEKECGPGFKFNGATQVCDDIDECQFGIVCPRPKTCKNTNGSYICEGDDRPQCPPGFYFKPATETCADIDECITGDNDCNKESQTCLNIIGNYTCVDKASRNTCPPGFKKNSVSQLCEDINECEENSNLCGPGEVCVNEPGAHNCVPSTGPTKPLTIAETKLTTKPVTDTSRPPSKKPITQTSRTKPTVQTTITRKPTTTKRKPTTTTTRKPTTTTTTTTKPTTPLQPAFIPVSCPKGYKYVLEKNSCIDIDECQEDSESCDSNQDCYNTPGSFICTCKAGFTTDHRTRACIDVNECQLQIHDCTVAERCDNTIGSYHCARITGCGTGYTLNYASGLCEDDDECILGTHNCNELGPNFRCRNLLGSYRCEVIRPPTRIYSTPTTRVTYPARRISTQNYPMISGQLKKCLPGYRMNQRGECEDINECESNPCGRGEKCLNFNGRYQCTSPMQCTIGYELNEDGNKCVDVNECSRGTHKCNPTQICKNGVGFYICDCPRGHHMNKITQRCEDMDECKLFRPCGANAECINIAGSYTCKCLEGFTKKDNFCDDIDECSETTGLCEHSCVNTWGSYRCACKPGFSLTYDNRTCNDLDECERFKNKNLCIGSCKNVPGSYVCECPRGYKLGNDGRVCIDIDECVQNVCAPDDICLNTRGGYKCYTIDCPKNYIKDPEHRSRCKRPHTLCDPRDYQCLMVPEQYTYQYMTLVSNLPLSDNHIQLFQIKGPQWTEARADFTMKLLDVNCPYGIQKVNEHFFRKQSLFKNSMQLYLVRPIQGPQEVKLQIEMRLFHGNSMIGNVVVYLIIVVSEYTF